MAGYHVVHWTEGDTWGGVSSDHITEEILMQSLKSTGSVTRGKGIEEVQCNIYNLSQPACAKVSTSIEELTGTKHISSDK